MLGGEERTIGRFQSVDREVVDDDASAEEVNLQPVDVNRPLQLPRADLLGVRAHARSQVDRQRRDDCGGKNRGREHQREAAEPKRLVPAQA